MSCARRENARRFQLTHSRGVRPLGIEIDIVDGHFNSRTHVECDAPATWEPLGCKQFQLTHSRGVRLR